jgi:glycine/D-amino acid oxidase-like deaminating enzyme
LHEIVASDQYAGGLVDMGSGHLHPLDLVQGEARAAHSLGVRIFEQSPVLRIEHGPGDLHTARGRCAPAAWCWAAMRTWMNWNRA